MSFGPGDLIDGKFRILRLIGDGGMGSVYEARHELLGVPVALKFLHSDLAKRPGLSARFLQEARVSATIQSQHVAHVTDVDTAADGSPYIVMELLQGESLQTQLSRRGKLPPDLAVDFTLQILAGLEVAHALGVVHRDLKPDNVFVTPATGGPLLKLIDFGIAKLKESSEYKKELTRAGVVMGTPEYMAPEQFYAAREVDHRADIYSLGVMLFEMLSGSRPADGDSPEAIIGAVMSGKVKRLLTLEPNLPPALVAVVERAMASDRERRFANSLEMRVELSRCAGELSPAGRAAATPVPLHAQAAAPPAEAAPANPAARAAQAAAAGLPDTLDGAEPAVPKTLPPDAGDAPRRPTGTAAAVPIGAQPWVAPVPGHPLQAPRRRRRSRWPWVLGSFVILALGVGVVLAASGLIGERRSLPDLPAPTPTTEPADSADLVNIQPIGTSPPPIAPDLPVAPRSGTHPGSVTASGTTATHTHTGTGTSTDTGATPGTFPLPFPPLALPSTLPPLPSGLPTALPTVFPTALPSFLPQIPGLTLPGQAPPSSSVK